MPTVSQALIRRNGRPPKSPKVPHKRPRVPRAVETAARSNSRLADPPKSRQNKKRGMSVDTTRETLDCWPSNDELNERKNDEEEDDGNRLFHCIFSDGSKRVLSSSQLNYLQLHGTLPAERSGSTTADLSIGDQQRRMVEHMHDSEVKELPRLSSDEIQASHYQAAQLQMETQRMAQAALQAQYQVYQQDPVYAEQYTRLPGDILSQQRSGAIEYYPSFKNTEDQHRMSMKQPSSDDIRRYQEQYMRAANIHQYKPNIQITEEQQVQLQQQLRQRSNSPPEVQRHTITQQNNMPHQLQWINNGAYQNQMWGMTNSQQDIALVPVSVVPELSQFPTPPRDPTDSEELKKYHQSVETFLKQQNESMHASASCRHATKPGAVQDPKKVMQQKTPQAVVPSVEPSLFRNFLNRLTGDLTKRSGCHSILGCLNSQQ